MEGVSHLINNKFSDTVTYKLDTVETKDKGYLFKVGEGIKNIKSILNKETNHLKFE